MPTGDAFERLGAAISDDKESGNQAMNRGGHKIESRVSGGLHATGPAPVPTTTAPESIPVRAPRRKWAEDSLEPLRRRCIDHPGNSTRKLPSHGRIDRRKGCLVPDQLTAPEKMELVTQLRCSGRRILVGSSERPQANSR